ncbi:4-diphosphocytidyl-2-C-methyl-D-erythritol kinase [Acetitomaculum ruminis DSM 5522]|uniref:4-diphosphocytidyl-2-C-methyl-D-erythritol kinase n=1 Tax=Acetitomaculum ruminis DSM 5522 TaxID=1120918 RepID=A0A1I0W7K8_9FIRM|nr:4-(cytidine 5'-diphospho)-2-C-methyl-D-erythritol kinase [Acetitomaculum ruminis]SFA83896.1 4-diphosphocytidyl-2-C-methyl-D-erythritol kinase [Acetitomaculum ruminis DSM 5522]
MQDIKLKARAKINLSLDVMGVRQDGYHLVSMVMQNIDLYDEITMEKTREDIIRINTNMSILPNDENNLCYKAAALMREKYHIKDGIFINLSKKIPIAAGMAGGSSDAAAVMKGINEMFDLGIKEEELREDAVKIGADVPYCIMGGTALSEGIGEILTRLPFVGELDILIAKPDISVSTKSVYESLVLDENTKHPDTLAMINAIKNKDYKKMYENMSNVLESVTITMHPVIAKIKEMMENHGADKALMSGSGPTVFGIFEDSKKAMKAAEFIKESSIAKEVFLTKTWGMLPCQIM